MADDNGRTGTSKRAANVSASERQLLVDLVSARADVIENKKTDGATSREKEAAWVAVAANFNSISTVKRQHRQLKQAYENMKKRAKKSAANEKVERLRTGGGSFVASTDAIDQSLLSVLGNRAQPLPSEFDSHAQYQSVFCLVDPTAPETDSIYSQCFQVEDVKVSHSDPVTRVTNDDLLQPALTSSSTEFVLSSALPVASSSLQPAAAVTGTAAAAATTAGATASDASKSAAIGSFGTSKKWAGRRRPAPCTKPAAQPHIATADKIGQLADEKTTFYKKKLEMRQDEHKLRMQVLKLKKQYYEQMLGKTFPEA